MEKPVTLLSCDALARLLPTSETAFPGSDRAHRQGSRSGKGGKTNRRDGKAGKLRYRLEGVRGAEIGESYATDVSQSFRKFVHPTGIPAGGVVALRIPDASSFEKSYRDKKHHAIPNAVRGARNRYGAPAGRYLANDDAYVVDPPAQSPASSREQNLSVRKSETIFVGSRALVPTRSYFVRNARQMVLSQDYAGMQRDRARRAKQVRTQQLSAKQAQEEEEEAAAERLNVSKEQLRQFVKEQEQLKHSKETTEQLLARRDTFETGWLQPDQVRSALSRAPKAIRIAPDAVEALLSQLPSRSNGSVYYRRLPGLAVKMGVLHTASRAKHQEQRAPVRIVAVASKHTGDLARESAVERTVGGFSRRNPWSIVGAGVGAAGVKMGEPLGSELYPATKQAMGPLGRAAVPTKEAGTVSTSYMSSIYTKGDSAGVPFAGVDGLGRKHRDMHAMKHEARTRGLLGPGPIRDPESRGRPRSSAFGTAGQGAWEPLPDGAGGQPVVSHVAIEADSAAPRANGLPLLMQAPRPDKNAEQAEQTTGQQLESRIPVAGGVRAKTIAEEVPQPASQSPEKEPETELNSNLGTSVWQLQQSQAVATGESLLHAASVGMRIVEEDELEQPATLAQPDTRYDGGVIPPSFNASLLHQHGSLEGGSSGTAPQEEHHGEGRRALAPGSPHHPSSSKLVPYEQHGRRSEKHGQVIVQSNDTVAQDAFGDRAVSAGFAGTLEPRKPRARTFREKMISLRLGADKCAAVLGKVHRSFLLVAFTKWHRASDAIGEQQQARRFLQARALRQFLSVVEQATERLIGYKFELWRDTVMDKSWNPFGPPDVDSDDSEASSADEFDDDEIL